MKKTKYLLWLIGLVLFSMKSQAQTLIVATAGPYCEGSSLLISLLGSEEDFFATCYSNDPEITYWYKFSIVSGPGTIDFPDYTNIATTGFVAEQTDWFNPVPTKVKIEGYTQDGNGTYTLCQVAEREVTFTVQKDADQISGPSQLDDQSSVVYTYPQISGVQSYQWDIPAGWSGSSSTNSITVTPGNNPGDITLETFPALNACNYPATKSISLSDCYTYGYSDHNFCGSSTWSNVFPNFVYPDQLKYPRMIADFNGDGKDDIIGFGNTEVLVGISDGSQFNHSTWTNSFTYQSGSGNVQDKYPRMLGDFNGDGMTDIIGFGHDNTAIGLSYGSYFNTSGFAQIFNWTYVQGYTNRNVVQRMIGDFDGNGKDDVIGFGYTGINVGLSNGSSFVQTPWGGGTTYTANSGGMNDMNKWPKMIGDFNGDGRDDVIGFGHTNVVVGISSGNSGSGYYFDNSTWATGTFTASQGHEQRKYPRMIGDFNGDGKDDIIAFGHDNIAVGISTGSSFNTSYWLSGEDFTYASGWHVDAREIGVVSLSDFGDAFPDTAKLHEIRIGDANGDGMDDIIGFCTDGVYVAYSIGTHFQCPDKYSSYSNNGGFDLPTCIRQIGNFDNTDDAIEIIGFGYSGTVVMDCDNCGTSVATAELANYDGIHQESGYMGWTADVHEYCENNVTLDISGTTCEDRYFIEIHEFDIATWTNTNTIYTSGWIINNSPDEIDLSGIYTFQPGKLYRIVYGVGPDWDTEDLWLEMIQTNVHFSLAPNELSWKYTKGGLYYEVNGYCTNVISFNMNTTESSCYDQYKVELIQVSTNDLSPIGSAIVQVPSGGGWTTGTVSNISIPTSGLISGNLYRLQFSIQRNGNTYMFTRYVEKANCTIGAGPKGRLAGGDKQKSRIYPNPSLGDYVNIELVDYSENNVLIEIHTLTGEVIKSVKMKLREQSTLEIGDIANGTYYITIKGDDFTETHSFVKQ